MDIKSYIVDSFISDVFDGNPAGVCILPEWRADEELLQIAKANDMPETAMLVQIDSVWHIRWFSPVCEVDLCGHATLAAGYILFNEAGIFCDHIVLQSGVGELTVSRERESIVLDFPVRLGALTGITQELVEAIGAEPIDVYSGVDIMAVFASQECLEALTPDLDKVRMLDCRGVIVTAPGKDSDFVSRFFAPKLGIDEDHVTGSAHCQLVPYWADKLGKKKLLAYQLSPRGGELICELNKNRVYISGRCRLAQ